MWLGARRENVGVLEFRLNHGRAGEEFWWWKLGFYDFMEEGVVDVFDSVFCIRLVVVGFMEIHSVNKNIFLTHQEAEMGKTATLAKQTVRPSLHLAIYIDVHRIDT